MKAIAGIRKFNPITTPLNKAEPCIVQVLKDDGGQNWYQGAKPGQLIQLGSGEVKAYHYLDPDKIRNFASITDLEEESEKTIKIKAIPHIQNTYEITDNKDIQISKNAKIKLRKIPQSKKGEVELTLKEGEFFFLDPNKIKNFNSQRGLKKTIVGKINKDWIKPVMGFTLYEKEFSALPTRVVHDAQKLSGWMDYVAKNFKDWSAQKIEASTQLIIMILVVAAVAVFLLWKFGVFDSTTIEPVKATAGQIATIN